MIAVGLVALCPFLLQGEAWAQIWNEVERLRWGKPDPAESELLRVHLREAAGYAPGDARGDLLRAQLEALEGRDATRVALRLAPIDPPPFSPRERWFLADLLPPGPERTASVLAALEGTPDPAQWQLVLAWNAGIDEVRALRLDHALVLQEDLERRCEAAWSAIDLAHTYRLLGQREAAERALNTAIAREEGAGRPTRGLWAELGLNAVGFGDEARGRDYLGKALALGSDDAGLMLACLDLMTGRGQAARRGFRALILDQPPPDWAWRGWGTTLLPPALAAPARTSSHPPE